MADEPITADVGGHYTSTTQWIEAEHVGCQSCIADFVGDRRGEHHFGVRLGDVLLGPPLLNGEPRRDVYEVELGENGRGWVVTEPVHLCCRCGDGVCYSIVRGYWSMSVTRRAS